MDRMITLYYNIEIFCTPKLLMLYIQQLLLFETGEVGAALEKEGFL